MIYQDICPTCGDKKPNTYFPQLKQDGKVYVDCICTKCKSTWKNVYTFEKIKDARRSKK
jgi:DNA-directed RNA polymerase subunit M/transcription elongation factor TFIIS